MTTVDEAIELLTDLPAGERDDEGEFPEGGMNYLVEKRLIELAQKHRDFAEGMEEDSSEQEEEPSGTEE